MDSKKQGRDFAPLVGACVQRGIGRTVAFELAATGVLETFRIGRRRFVFLDSLLTLPERLAERKHAA